MEKTQNYAINMIQPMQLHKEVVLNESLISIDNFLKMTVEGFVTFIPDDKQSGLKYIIKTEPYINQICYYSKIEEEWQFLQPQESMVFFCKQLNAFILYRNGTWVNCNQYGKLIDLSALEEKSHVFDVTVNSQIVCIKHPDNNFIDLRSSCSIDVSAINYDKFRIVITQLSEDPCEVLWTSQISWVHNIPYNSTKFKGSVDVIDFHQINRDGQKFVIANIISPYY